METDFVLLRRPARPHPHVLGAVDEWTSPKPGDPPMRDVPSAEVLEVYPSQHESLVAVLLATTALRNVE